MKRSTKVCLVFMVLIFIGIIVTCVQVTRYVNSTSYMEAQASKLKMRHVITLTENNMQELLPMAERFPYVAAVTRNATNLWPFACFASVILFKWIITSAHCRMAGYAHHVILFHDYARNQTHSFPIQFWRIHERYNITINSPKYDIAVAKLNLDNYPFILRPAVFNETKALEAEAAMWKTVSTMNKKIYLTNHFEKYEVKIGNPRKCFESYGVEVDDSMICVDMSDYEDCFVHEFGPIYSGDKVVGVIAVQPADCDMKLSIFTNISYFTNWILRTTYEG